MRPFAIPVLVLSLSSLACGLLNTGGPPALTPKNIHLASPDLRIWGVEATSEIRQGSSTSSEQGTVNVEWSNGATTSHDATYKVTSGTLFQDGKVCHNYGPKCYCGTTTFRLESGMTQWKFGVPSNNEPVDCPSGVEPTGDPEIKKSVDVHDKKALKEMIERERAASRNRNR